MYQIRMAEGRTDSHRDGRQERGAQLIAPGVLADIGHGHVCAEAQKDTECGPELPATMKKGHLGQMRFSE